MPPKKRISIIFTVLLIAIMPASAIAANTPITFGAANTYTPSKITIAPNDSVTWTPEPMSDFQFHPLLSDQNIWPVQNDPAKPSFSQTFTTPGTYTYHCAAHEMLGMKGTIVVTAGDPPSPIISATKTTVNVGETVTFSSDQSTATNGKQLVKRGWDFDGNETIDSEETNPSTTYATPGSYPVTFSLTDSAGLTAKQTVTITVNKKTDTNQTGTDTVPPKINLTTGKSTSFNQLRKKGLQARLSTDEPATIAIALKFGNRVIASSDIQPRSAGTTNLTLRFKKTAQNILKKALKKKRKLVLTLTAAAKDVVGNTSQTARSVVIKR